MNPRCEADGCAKQPSFGFPGERPRRCKAHMLEAMVRLFALHLGGMYIKTAGADLSCLGLRKT